MTRADEMLPSADQEKALDACLRVVKAEAFEMKRCLDKGKLMDGIKHASQMLGELRTSELAPKYYYRLYIDTTTELAHFESFLIEEYEKGHKMSDLYELVQYASNILPRLYLLVTVGVVHMKTGDGSRSEILKDLVEMCRGVQHPLRGLFLRNYLLQSTRNLLPDTAEYDDARGGSVRDAIDFILLNFSEMNKLWVRMQHQGPSREREKREKERLELRILVGTNLVRLSQLECLTGEIYQTMVLPGILEQCVSCRDPISQEYLMECVIQVFSDEFHLATLDEFLDACAKLHQDVKVKNVLTSLIERLSLWATSSEAQEGGASKELVEKQQQLFEVFSRQADTVIRSREDMPLEDIVALHVALASLALKCYPEKTDYANTVYTGLQKILADKNVKNVEYNSNLGREILKLLRIAVDEYADVHRVTDLDTYSEIVNFLDYRGRCSAASYIIQNMLEKETRVESQEQLAAVLALLEALLVDGDGQPADYEDSEDAQEEQTLVARLVHLLHSDDLDTHFLLLNDARKALGAGGKARIKYTLSPIVFELFKLAGRYEALAESTENWDAKVKKIFVCAMGTIGALISSAELSELPFRLYLQGAIVADQMKFDDSPTVVYEFLSKALSVLEDEISESRARLAALLLLISSLERLRSLFDENHEPLRTQVVLAASKLFKKPDQVRALCACAVLYWTGHVADKEGAIRDAKRVRELLQKAIKIASQCMEPLVQQQLFMHALNFYVFFYEDGCDEISAENVAELLARVRDGCVQLEAGADADTLARQLAHLLGHVRATAKEHPELYLGVTL